MPDLSCPICSADFPLSGDERKGDEVYCSYCGVPCRLTENPDVPACRVEEDL
ncbi:MAG: hypothetical protein GY772_05710 [bacterium]|nr:hypothetical protein [bacterium]